MAFHRFLGSLKGPDCVEGPEIIADDILVTKFVSCTIRYSWRRSWHIIFSQKWKLTSCLCGLWRHVIVNVVTTVSEETTASVITATTKLIEICRVRLQDHSLANLTDVYIHFINIYFRQHNYIIKAWVKANATCFDLKSHHQAKLRTMKFFTVWLRAFGIPDGLQFLVWFVSCT